MLVTATQRGRVRRVPTADGQPVGSDAAPQLACASDAETRRLGQRLDNLGRAALLLGAEDPPADLKHLPLLQQALLASVS